MTNPRYRFAPVSSAPSGFVAVASGYFILSGILSGGLLLIGVILLARGAASVNPVVVVANLLIRAGMTALCFWTAGLLSRRSRRARIIVAILIALPIMELFFGAPVTGMMIVWTVLSVTVLAVIWRDLDQ